MLAPGSLDIFQAVEDGSFISLPSLNRSFSALRTSDGLSESPTSTENTGNQGKEVHDYPIDSSFPLCFPTAAETDDLFKNFVEFASLASQGPRVKPSRPSSVQSLASCLRIIPRQPFLNPAPLTSTCHSDNTVTFATSASSSSTSPMFPVVAEPDVKRRRRSSSSSCNISSDGICESDNDSPAIDAVALAPPPNNASAPTLDAERGALQSPLSHIGPSPRALCPSGDSVATSSSSSSNTSPASPSSSSLPSIALPTTPFSPVSSFSTMKDVDIHNYPHTSPPHSPYQSDVDTSLQRRKMALLHSTSSPSSSTSSPPSSFLSSALALEVTPYRTRSSRHPRAATGTKGYVDVDVVDAGCSNVSVVVGDYEYSDLRPVHTSLSFRATDFRALSAGR